MPSRTQKLIRASRKLARYSGLSTIEDLAARIAFDKISDPANATSNEEQADTSIITPSEVERRLIQLVIDTADGILLTRDLIREIEDALSDTELDSAAQEELRKRFGKLLQVHHSKDSNFVVAQDHIAEEDTEVTINQMLAYGDGQGANSPINATPSEPSKEQPNLAIYLSNSVRVTPGQREVNPITLFLNSIPNVELSRAVPFVDVKFVTPQPPTSTGNRISSLSLPRFLLGAEKVEGGSTLDTMVNSRGVKKTVEQDGEEIEKTFTASGMELFTAPQTLVNADDNNAANAIRGNELIDKFRPLMSLNDLSINVVSTHGLMSFKTGQLNLTLHDRARLPEVAPFVRADLYSQNEIEIEYGWSHPAGESEAEDNVYGDLINGMRSKEKYMVRNSSFNFDEAGQVQIKLDIAMKGGTEQDTELISSDNETFGNIVREINELSKTIGELKKKIFDVEDTETKEVRGVQILDTAQDALNHTSFTKEMKKNLRNFRTEMDQSDNPKADELLNALEQIYGDEARDYRRSGESESKPLVTQLRHSIQEGISNKISKLQETPDPFIIEGDVNNGRRLVKSNPTDNKEVRRLKNFQDKAIDVDVKSDEPVSLAKLLLHFVGEPLANTGKYDEVQLVFYPFNAYAGYAAKDNIANFIVDVDYFADELARYRLQHAARSANLSLQEFMDFIADTLLDDPAAPSYGLHDQGEKIFENVVNEDGTALTTRTTLDSDDYQTRLEKILRGVTPDGSFKMPQIEIYTESAPRKKAEEDGVDLEESDDKTILRLHIFDSQTTAYDSLNSLLQSSRDEQISVIGRMPQLQGGNRGVVESREAVANGIINAALEVGLIELIPNEPPGKVSNTPDSGVDRMFRVKGGQQKLKDFIMTSMPYIIYGAAGSTIREADLSSMQNSSLNTVNMLRSFRKDTNIAPNGENPGGLPLRIIPTELSITSLGCPIVNFAQQFFVDFQTGTTADNIYSVSELTHKFSPGEFRSEFKFAPLDAWGKYESLVSRVGNAMDVLRQISSDQNEGNPNSSGTESNET